MSLRNVQRIKIPVGDVPLEYDIDVDERNDNDRPDESIVLDKEEAAPGSPPHSSLPGMADGDLIIGLSDRPRLKLKYMRAVEAVLQPKASWPICYKSASLKAVCRQHLQLEKHIVWFHICQILDAPISYCLAQANEFDLWPRWHTLCSKNIPIGPDNDPLRRVSHWHKSIAFGLLKGEVLCDIHRFINPAQGFYIEHVKSLDEDDPLYFSPECEKTVRDETWASLMLVPLTRGTTLVATTIKSGIPASVPNLVVKRLVAPLGGQFCSVYHKTLKTIMHPTKGKIWRDRVDEDATGLYKMVDTITPLNERVSSSKDKKEGVSSSKDGYLNEELQTLLQLAFTC